MNSAHRPLNALANTLSRTRQAQHLPRPLFPGCYHLGDAAHPVGVSRRKWCAPGFKTPICLSPAPLARGEFGGAWGMPFCPGFRAAPGRLFFGFFLLATQKKEPRCRSIAACKQHRAAVHQTNHQRLAATLVPRMRLRLIRATSHFNLSDTTLPHRCVGSSTQR